MENLFVKLGRKILSGVKEWRGKGVLRANFAWGDSQGVEIVYRKVPNSLCKSDRVICKNTMANKNV